MAAEEVTLVIFTCEGRERLLQQCFKSFSAACNFKFKTVILALDGQIDPSVISLINPDVVVQSYKRKGYVNNITQTIGLIDTNYFFWLEDDWKFHTAINLRPFIEQLNINRHWVQVVYNKENPALPGLKGEPLVTDLYKTTFGFSANPCISKTAFIREGFRNLLKAPKGDKLGEDGFENFLSRYFEQQNLICVIYDTADRIISHEGYLESTARNWHMTNSLEQKTEKHLLIIPKPGLWRKLVMVGKLTSAFFRLSFKQLVNDEIYEFCFRIISTLKTMRKRG
jgi:hypothetical protein